MLRKNSGIHRFLSIMLWDMITMVRCNSRGLIVEQLTALCTSTQQYLTQVGLFFFCLSAFESKIQGRRFGSLELGAAGEKRARRGADGARRTGVLETLRAQEVERCAAKVRALVVVFCAKKNAKVFFPLEVVYLCIKAMQVYAGARMYVLVFL